MLIEAVDLAAGKAGSDNNILNKHTNTRREFYTIGHIRTIFYSNSIMAIMEKFLWDSSLCCNTNYELEVKSRI